MLVQDKIFDAILPNHVIPDSIRKELLSIIAQGDKKYKPGNNYDKYLAIILSVYEVPNMAIDTITCVFTGILLANYQPLARELAKKYKIEKDQALDCYDKFTPDQINFIMKVCL